MKRAINTRRTYRAIRQLPLEVSFAQVEQWIKNQSDEPKSFSFFDKLKKWLNYQMR